MVSGVGRLQGFHYGNRSAFFKMETHAANLVPRMFARAVVFSAAIVLSFFVCATTAYADAAAELASFSVFPKVDLAQLSKGESKPVRSPASSNIRHLSVQTVYVAPMPPAQLLAKMRDWTPTRHPELKVYLHSDSATNFSKLQSAPDNPAVRYLTDATAQHSSDLQLSAAEMKMLPSEGSNPGSAMPASVAAAWGKILTGRAQAFASGGSSSQAAYENVTPAVRPSDELGGMLRGQEKLRRQFSGFLEGTGIGRGSGSIKPEMFWELLSADEKGVLTLGASYNRPGGGGTIQAANALYYASGGYYAGITLYQMWPVEVEGRVSTLVWRGDLISSASISSLRGIERMAAESTMIKDISKAVAFFRRDIGTR
jgi:hypothetical protein